MKKTAIRMIVMLNIVLIASSSYAWKNPFQDQQRNANAKLREDEEPTYNITLGSIFGIYVEPGIDPIDEFERKPDIYISYETGDPENPKTKTKKIKILKKDSHYPNGKLEFPCQLLVCEWTKKLDPGNYELWVKPKNNGKEYDPCRVTGSFTLNKPVIQKVEEIDGENDKLVYVKITGLYFSITPNVFVFYTKTNKKGNLIKIKQKCKITSKTIDRVTGESEAVFTFKKKTNTSWSLAGENGELLVEIKNKVGSNCSTTAGNTWFTDANYGDCPDPAFGDLDGDGDLDLVVGVKDATFNYYENTGTAQAPVFTQRFESANPFNHIDLHSYGCPWLADMDGDGDLDLLAGTFKGINVNYDNFIIGEIFYFENTGSSTSPNFEKRTDTANPFNFVSTFYNPMTVDLDNDGDLDLVCTSLSGNIYYYENFGSAANPVFEDQSDNRDHPFRDINYGLQTTVALADLNHDGDLDLVVSDIDGKFIYYTNTGTPETPLFTSQTNPFENFDIGECATPVFADLNGDGWPELVCGSRHGTLYCFQNNTTPLPTYHKKRFLDMMPNEINGFSIPCFGDLNNDGHHDLVIGTGWYGLGYYPYNKSLQVFVSEPLVEANPFYQFLGKSSIKPFLADLDNDGDLDLIFAYYSPPELDYFSYYKNIGTPYTPSFERQVGDNDPFSHIWQEEEYHSRFVPSLADMDNDGDLDLIVSNIGHSPSYYENTGSAEVPVFVKRTESANPLASVSTDSLYCVARPGDVDNDGDLDLILSDMSGMGYCHINSGTKENPEFLKYHRYIINFDVSGYKGFGAPFLINLNEYDNFDSNLDIVCGTGDGRLIVFIYKSINTVISFY